MSSLYGEAIHDFDGEEDVGDRAATREIGNREVEALEDGAGDGETGELLESFIEEIAGVEIGGDEDVGAAGDRGVGELFGADAGVNCGVELHFAVDEEGWVGVGGEESLEMGEGILHEGDRVVTTAAAGGGEGKQSDAGCAGEDGLGAGDGLRDNFAELGGSGVLAGGHIREEIGLGGGGVRGRLLHDGEARKS